jgi:hypothetical protein
MARDLHPAENMRGALRALLEARRDRICAELGEYPRPVPACDVHYNRLLEERTAVCRDLEQLDEASLDDAAARRLLALLAPVSGS